MTDNTTLKKIQYLLEDYTRLTEVSKKELTEWEDAMPFYQPLKLLLAKKNEMLGMKSTDVSSATFYNNDIDFDLYESKEGIDPLEVEEIVLEQELPVVEVVETNTSSETTEVIETIVDGDSYSKEIEKRIVELPEKALHVIDHELASDELEESLPEELAEHLDFSSITGYTSIDDYDLNEIKLNESDREKISMGILSNLKVDVVQNSTDVETEVEEETVQEYVVKKDKKVKSKKKKKKKKKKVVFDDQNSNEESDDGVLSFTSWLNRTKSIDPKSKKKKEKKKKKSKSKSKVKNKGQEKVIAEANKSIQKDNTIISETLADILASQGHNAEAKEMYKQLSLLFPEKSSYFADKIKNL